MCNVFVFHLISFSIGCRRCGCCWFRLSLLLVLPFFLSLTAYNVSVFVDLGMHLVYKFFIWPHSNYDALVPFFARISLSLSFSSYVLHRSLPTTFCLFLSHGLFKWLSIRYVLYFNNIFAFSRIYSAVILRCCFVRWNSFRCRRFSSQQFIEWLYSLWTWTTLREKKNLWTLTKSNNNNNNHSKWHLKSSANGWERNHQVISNFVFRLFKNITFNSRVFW